MVRLLPVGSALSRIAGRILALAVLAVLVLTARGQSLSAARQTPWSVYAYSAKGVDRNLPSSCHPLAYFSGSPLRFDYGDAMYDWPAGSFTFTSSEIRLGTAQGHRIYQVNQEIHPSSSIVPSHAFPGQTGGMKRLLVERKPDDYCLIFQEQDFYKTIFEFEPAQLLRIQRELVLHTSDPLSGNGGFVLDRSWTFNHGVPTVLDPGSVVGPVIQKIAPPDCQAIKGYPWNLATLSYRSDLWRSNDSMAGPSCGSISIKLAFKNHRLVVTAAKFTPGSKARPSRGALRPPYKVRRRSAGFGR